MTDRDTLINKSRYGDAIVPARSSSDPVSPVKFSEIEGELLAYLKDNCDNETSIVHGPTGFKLYPAWSRLQTARGFKLTLDDASFSFSYERPFAVLDAHETLELFHLMDCSPDSTSQLQLAFRAGESYTRFIARRDGVERLAASRKASNDGMPKRKTKFDDKLMQRAWDQSRREIVGNRKRSAQMQRAAEIAKCSLSKVKRWLRDKEKDQK